MKMRVLLVHNHYRSSEPSGEKQVLEMERDLLRSHGHVLREYSRHSDEILREGIKGALKGALSTPWNPFSAKAVTREVEDFSPDVVHVHNTFPLISPSIFHSIGSRAARVLTLHNYRLFCPAAIPMREGKVCTQCMQTCSVWPSIKHGCYKKSRIATLPLAMSVTLHRLLKTWTNEVDAFIVLTEFQRSVMVDAGLPEDLVHVKPNFFPESPDVLPWEKRKPSVLFVGRLTEEKGVEFLIRAWMNWGASAPELLIIGDGCLREKLTELAGRHSDVPIRFLGKLSREDTLSEIARSSLAILPSICFETFGLVLVEAFAFGTPVAVSNIGPLPAIVRNGENGLVFNAGEPDSLLEVVRSAWQSKGRLGNLASVARQTSEKLYTEQVNYDSMMVIYEKALEVSRKRKGSRG